MRDDNDKVYNIHNGTLTESFVDAILECDTIAEAVALVSADAPQSSRSELEDVIVEHLTQCRKTLREGFEAALRLGGIEKRPEIVIDGTHLRVDLGASTVRVNALFAACLAQRIEAFAEDFEGFDAEHGRERFFDEVAKILRQVTFPEGGHAYRYLARIEDLESERDEIKADRDHLRRAVVDLVGAIAKARDARADIRHDLEELCDWHRECDWYKELS